MRGSVNHAQNFFIKAVDILYGPSFEGSEDVDQTLAAALEKASKGTFDALCDSFNTPVVLSIISDLITTYNSAENSAISWKSTQEIARWVTSMVNTLGLNGTASPDDEATGWSGIGVPEEAKQYLIPLSKLRDSLRQKIKSPDGLTPEDTQLLVDSTAENIPPDTAEPSPYFKVLHDFHASLTSIPTASPTASPTTLSQEILQLCDRVRDTDLWGLSIYLEDREVPQPALIRRVTPALRAARQERDEGNRQREAAKVERAREAQAKADKGRLSPMDMFRTDEYSEWDRDGIPVRDKEGKEITKSRAKKLRKEWERQKKLHEVWAETNGEGE